MHLQGGAVHGDSEAVSCCNASQVTAACRQRQEAPAGEVSTAQHGNLLGSMCCKLHCPVELAAPSRVLAVAVHACSLLLWALVLAACVQQYWAQQLGGRLQQHHAQGSCARIMKSTLILPSTLIFFINIDFFHQH